METTWIVSANASRARFFARSAPKERPEEISDMVNTAARLRNGDIDSDGQGQRAASKSRHGGGAPTQPSGYEPNQSPAEHQTEMFARSVCDYLSKAQETGRFRHLVVVASPEFLGLLRKLLDPKLIAAVSLEINKDYTGLRPDELGEQIRSHTEKA